jgi:hypothetical protein
MEDSSKQRHPRWIWWLVGGAVGLSLIISATLWFIGPKVWTDGESLRVLDRDTRVREVIWTRPQALEGFASDEQVYEPSISPDGTELYFVRGKAGGSARIYLSLRRNNAWTAPTPVDAVNGTFDSLGPRLTPDGKFLLFYSNRPGGFGGYDIWAAPRAAPGWGKPFNLGPQVNSEFNEFNPDPTPDGRHLILATNRKAAKREQNEAWRSTIRETVSSDYDLWIADSVLTAPATTKPTTLAFHPAREIPGINTEFTEGASCMSPAGDFLYFASNRPGGLGKFDIYRCRVHGDQFGPVENVGKPLNSVENEADPALAYNGFRMVFSSDRPGADGRYQLLVSDSREVYPEHQARPMPHLGWSWWLLIISLLALIPLLLMMRGWDDRRFSTIQKCLLMSLLVHALITFILSFVAVTQKVTQYVREQSQLEVAVNLGDSRGVEETLAIRGQVSGDLPVSAPAPPSLAPSRVANELVQAANPVAIDTPAAPAMPGGITIPVETPHVGLPTPREPAAQVTPGIGTTGLPDVALPQARQVSQTESTPTVQAARSSTGRIAASETSTSVTANLALPSGPPASSASSQLDHAANSIRSVAANLANSGAASPTATISPTPDGPQVAPNGSLPPIGRASAAEPQLAVAISHQGPTTRPLESSAFADATPGPSSARIDVQSPKASTPSGQGGLTAAPQASRPPISSNAIASAARPAINAGQQEIDPPEPEIASAVGKIGSTSTRVQSEGQAVIGPAVATGGPIAHTDESAGAGNPAMVSARVPGVATDNGSMAQAPSNRSQVRSVQPGASTAAAPAASLADAVSPNPIGPKVSQPGITGGIARTSEKPISAGAPTVSSGPTRGASDFGAAHAIDITPAPILAAGKASPSGRGDVGMGGIPTARAQVASTQIQPEVSPSALTGPLGPGKSLVPDLTVIRSPEQRKPMLEQFGGTKESEDAVARGLAYLARVQDEDGHWTRIEGDSYRRRRRSLGQHDMACTGLALLAFLGHDETPDKPGPYRDVATRAVDYLIAHQDDDGDLRGLRQFRGGGADSANMYDQGIATYALAECAIMTHDPRVIDAAIKGAKFIVAAQNDLGGWRYSPGEYGDSSVFGWQIMALHSAQQVGFDIPTETVAGAKRYIHSCGEGRHHLLAGYQPHTGATPAMTAELLFSRMLLDMPLDEDGINEATRFLARDPPEMQRADLYYWYYASLSMLHMQNPLWKDWNILTRESLIRMQMDDGGWDVNLKWGERGGRVFTTALSTLTLEVYYRYLPLRHPPDTQAGNDPDRR